MGQVFLREKRQMLGLLHKCLTLVRSGSHLIPGVIWLGLQRKPATTRNSREKLRQITLKVTFHRLGDRLRVDEVLLVRLHEGRRSRTSAKPVSSHKRKGLPCNRLQGSLRVEGLERESCAHLDHARVRKNTGEAR